MRFAPTLRRVNAVFGSIESEFSGSARELD
jgi:hypothetical protein